MNVFADYHHGGLYYSLVRLFENRMGAKLYRPIGTEWFDEKRWAYSQNVGTMHQYLDIPHDFQPDSDGVVEMPWAEGEQRFTMRGITLEGFKKMDFDYAISSVIQHEAPYKRMMEEFHPRGAHIRQMGNIHDTCDYSICRNVLNSTWNKIPEGVNTVTYSQEFSLEDYHPDPVPRQQHTIVNSFLNVMPEVKDYPLWLSMRAAMPDYTWRAYGIVCPDGNLPSSKMPSHMKISDFVCHLKWWGDGFGHVIHMAAACGKPILTKGVYYNGMMGSRLLTDGVTYIDLTDDLASNVEKIRFYSDPDRYAELSRNMYQRFKDVVNFDKDEMNVRAFLERARPAL